MRGFMILAVAAGVAVSWVGVTFVVPWLEQALGVDAWDWSSWTLIPSGWQGWIGIGVLVGGFWLGVWAMGFVYRGWESLRNRSNEADREVG